MQEEEKKAVGEPKRELIGPTEPPVPQVSKCLVEFLNEPPVAEIEEPAIVDLREAIAEKIRTDCSGLRVLTSEETLVELVPEGDKHAAVSAALAEMAKDPGYADIKAVTTASGLVFFYSERHIKVAEAAAKSLLEEVKFRIGAKVRADSKDTELLTPVEGLYAEIGWDKSSYNPDEIRNDPRYDDIKTVTATTGEMFFYSVRHLSDYFALVLARVAAHDPCATIAETVRDESKNHPRPTCVLFFLEKVFGINEEDLKEVVCKTFQRPEFADIKTTVHPATGAVYLYSDKYLDAERAFMMMDYEEVIRPANP